MQAEYLDQKPAESVLQDCYFKRPAEKADSTAAGGGVRQRSKVDFFTWFSTRAVRGK